MRNETRIQIKKCISVWGAIALFCLIAYVAIHDVPWYQKHAQGWNTVGFLALLAIAIAILSWLVLSPIVVIWWFVRPVDRDVIRERGGSTVTSMYIGAFISLCIVLLDGFEKLLTFIPGQWGGFDEDGYLVSTRTTIAGWIAFGLSLFVAHLYERATELRRTSVKLREAEDKLKAEMQARHFADERVERLEGRIGAIMNRMEDLGIKELYEKAETADEAEAEAWVEHQLALLEEQELTEMAE